MDALDLARLQFAITVSAHFLFVVLTLGLAPLVGIMQTWHVVTGKPVYERMTRFWGQVYLINYALGIVTGLVMELQFGLNWSGLTHFAGEVFGAPLAMEALIAFAVESTLLGLWIFGWGRLPKAVHLASFWIVTLAAYLSAYWIMVANGFMQHPVGFEIADGTARLTDLGALMTNAGALPALYHILTVALTVAGFLVAGASAWHLLRGTEPDLFRRSMRIGVIAGFLGAWATLFSGYNQMPFINDFQPTKAAVLGGDGDKLAALQADLVLRYGPGDYTPPLWLEIPWQAMQVVGNLLFFFGFVLCVMLFRRWIERPTWLLRVMVWTIPLPYVAVISGWLIREIGRQPWVVWGHLKTADAASEVSGGTVLASLLVFTTIFVALIMTDYLLIARSIRRGPDAVLLGIPLGVADGRGDPPTGTRADSDSDVTGIAAGRQ